MRAITLDARLQAVARLVPPCQTVADIGADHGFLGAHLLLTGRCAFVRFMDISADSLLKARRLIGKLRLESRAAFLVGDGAAALPAPVDAAVIAGMGAELIAGIIARGREKLGDAKLVLAPNLDAPLVRRFLMENGYQITNEALVHDGRRFYPVIAAQPGEARYDPMAVLAGPILLQEKPDSLIAYANHRIRVIDRALPGAIRGGEPWVDELAEEREMWREVAHGSGSKDAGIGGGERTL